MTRPTRPPIERTAHQLDATDQVLGRLATKIATLLRGKHKVSWQPHLDVGDYVEVTNVEKLRLTGTKLKTKTYFRHTGRLGHWRAKPLDRTKASLGFALQHAVSGMLPKNRLHRFWLKRLIIK